ncbi:MAG: DUF6198 family protein [Treponema sp.]|nr:DUF6198 family protein [Treponema sp.]
MRYILFGAGLFIMSLGISLVTKANLGTSPISSVPYVLSLKFNLSFGQFTFIVNGLFILLEIVLLNKKFPKKQYFQIAVTVLFGFFVDVAMDLLFFINPSLYGQKILVLSGGCVVLALGIRMQVSANVIINCAEGLVQIIAEKTGKEFGTVKIAFDMALVTLALVISLVVFGTIMGLREGTLVCALTVGLITKLFKKIFQNLAAPLRRRAHR